MYQNNSGQWIWFGERLKSRRRVENKKKRVIARYEAIST
jgi:hypothetical protein